MAGTSRTIRTFTLPSLRALTDFANAFTSFQFLSMKRPFRSTYFATLPPRK